MPRFDIAHLREQGVDLIIVPLNRTASAKSDAELQAVADGLQVKAAEAGLAGTVVLVWESGGRMGFLTPPNFRRYFQSISLDFVRRNINRELYW